MQTYKMIQRRKMVQQTTGSLKLEN